MITYIKNLFTTKFKIVERTTDGNVYYIIYYKDFLFFWLHSGIGACTLKDALLKLEEIKNPTPTQDKIVYKD